MSSQVTPSEYLAPFVVEFTLAIIMTLSGKKFIRPKVNAIHADLVPKVSHHVMSAMMRERIIPPLPRQAIVTPPKKTVQHLHPPKPAPKPMQAHALPKPAMQTPVLHKPAVPKSINPEMAWEKLEPLLRDPTITQIECAGPGKPLVIVRGGRRQFTKLAFSADETKHILHHMAQEAHLPLLEGVFVASLDGYDVHAVVSDIVGSKFVIKKDTPYSRIS